MDDAPSRGLRCAAIEKRQHGLGGSGVVITKDRARDWPIQNLLPQAPPGRLVPDHRTQGAAKALRKAGHGTQARRQQRLNACPHLADKAWELTATGDGDHHGIAIDDSRHDECRCAGAAEAVDDIDGNTERPGGGGNGRVDFRLAGRSKDDTRAIGVVCHEPAGQMVDRPSGGEGRDLFARLWRHDGHFGSGGGQKPGLGSRAIATAHDNRRAPGNVKEDRQIIHFLVRQSKYPCKICMNALSTHRELLNK